MFATREVLNGHDALSRLLLLHADFDLALLATRILVRSNNLDTATLLLAHLDISIEAIEDSLQIVEDLIDGLTTLGTVDL